MAKLVVDQLDLSGKRVFLRADFNVPLEGTRVTDDTRITAVRPTIDCCLKGGASLVLASHLGRPKGKPDPKYSLRPIAERIEALLERPVALLPDCVGPEVEERARALRPGAVVLLENLRFHAEEEANDDAFARALAGLADVYVNDAFAAAHRAHASTAGIARHLKPAAAGLLMARELAALARIFERPARPLWAVLGGAKVSDKLGLVDHLLDRVDAARAILERARTRGIPLRLPVDVVAAPGLDAVSGLRTVAIREIPDDLMGLDIGAATVTQFATALKGARTIIWNGPMGVFEKEPFAAGTLGVGRAVADSGAFSVIGGGDTIAAVQQAGVMDRIGYVSTAGGAFLEFLEGRVLPGVAALDEAP